METNEQNARTPSADSKVYSTHPFVENEGFTIVAVGLGVAAAIFVFTLALVLPLIPFEIKLFIGLVAALATAVPVRFWYRAVRKRADEWAYTERQASVPVDQNWGVSERLVDRARHILTDSEEIILLVTRKTKWKLVLPLGMLGTTFGLILVGWSFAGSSVVMNLRPVRRLVRQFLRNTELDPTLARKIAPQATVEYGWIFVILLAVVAWAAILVWINWYYTFFMVTNRNVFPDLKLPPLYLPTLDSNELAWPLVGVKRIDPVDRPIQNLLGYGGAMIQSDASKETGKDKASNHGAIGDLIPGLPDHRKVVLVIRRAYDQLIGSPQIV